MLPANMSITGNEDYYDALYKKTTFAQDHNLSVTGNNGKLNYYVSGRFYGYDGLFRYNTDNYKMMNLRAKGSVQVFDWLKIENNRIFPIWITITDQRRRRRLHLA